MFRHPDLLKLISSRGFRFIMSNDRQRLIDNLKTSLPQRHAIVGIFVVGGCELGTESAQLGEQSPRRQQKNGRTVVHRPAKLVLRSLRIIASSVAQSASV